MLSLKAYYGKVVRIIATNGLTFIDVVDDYIYPEDNGYGSESIVLKDSHFDLYEFTKDNIQEITILA